MLVGVFPFTKLSMSHLGLLYLFSLPNLLQFVKELNWCNSLPVVWLQARIESIDKLPLKRGFADPFLDP